MLAIGLCAESATSTETLSSGGKAMSTNYSDDATIGDIVGVSTVPNAGVTLKSGFIGQLYEARSLAVSALPAAVVESGTTQLSAVATMDDDSLVRLGGSDAKWSVQDGPLAGISLSGLATAGEVFINGPATVRARWDGIAGDLTLTVLNANVTPPGDAVEVPGFLAQVFQPSMAGLYHGLLKDGGGNAVGAVTGFTLKSTRSFTAKVVFNGVTYSLAGALLADGSFSGEIKRTGKTALLVTLQLGRTPGGSLTLQGTVSGDGTTGGGFIAHSPFTKTQPVPGALVRSYTFLVPATATGTALLPEGDGFGSAKLTALGTITAAGRTGDGVAFTAGGFLTQDRQWHLFQPLYSSKGQLAGVLTFRDVPNVSDVDGGLSWVKNPNMANKSYPGGFQLAPTLVGAVYTPPLTGQPALTGLADERYNARLTLAGTVLPDGGLSKTLSWLGTNKLAYYGPETLTGTTTTSTGILTGSYTDPATKLTVPFAGAVLQKQGLAGGNFLVSNRAGYLLIEPGTTFGYPGSEDAGPLRRVALPETPASAPTTSAVTFTALAAGSYGGLLTNGGDITGGLESVVISKTGALSGTVVISGKRYAFKGALGVRWCRHAGDHPQGPAQHRRHDPARPRRRYDGWLSAHRQLFRRWHRPLRGCRLLPYLPEDRSSTASRSIHPRHARSRRGGYRHTTRRRWIRQPESRHHRRLHRHAHPRRWHDGDLRRARVPQSRVDPAPQPLRHHRRLRGRETDLPRCARRERSGRHPALAETQRCAQDKKLRRRLRHLRAEWSAAATLRR